jgi:HEPN domain-containing protein
MTIRESKRLVEFWIESSDRDFKAMNNMLKAKDYSWSLFVGHLVIEKLIKAYFIKQVKLQPPMIHNLVRIAELSDLPLSESQADDLVEITTFNISARYENQKQEFYKKATREYTLKWISKIETFRAWIKEQHLK